MEPEREFGHIEQKDRCRTGIGIGYTELKGRGGPELASVTFNGMTVVEPEGESGAFNGRALLEPELAPVTLNERAVVEPDLASVTFRGRAVVEPE